jgi:hypothetical protein
MTELKTLTYREVAKYIYKNAGRIVAFYYGYNPTVIEMVIEEGKNPLVLDLVNNFMEMQNDLKTLTNDNENYEILVDLRWESFYVMLSDYIVHWGIVDKHIED